MKRIISFAAVALLMFVLLMGCEKDNGVGTYTHSAGHIGVDFPTTRPPIELPHLAVATRYYDVGSQQNRFQVAMWNTGLGVVEITSVTTSKSWLTISQSPTTRIPADSVMYLDVSVNRAGQEAGTNDKGEIRITTRNAGNETIEVRMQVPQETKGKDPALRVSTRYLAIPGIAPKAQISLWNGGDGILQITSISSSVSWLQTSLTSISLPTDSMAYLDLTPDRTNLAKGKVHRARVTVMSLNGTGIIDVDVEVLASDSVVRPADLRVSTRYLAIPGIAPKAQISLWNGGDGTLQVTSISSSSSWLRTSLTSINLPADSMAYLDLTPDRTNLAKGKVHSARVVITSRNGGSDTVKVDVEVLSEKVQKTPRITVATRYYDAGEKTKRTQIAIWNTGDTDVRGVSISSTKSWLITSSFPSVLSPDSTVYLDVFINRNGRPVGMDSGLVKIVSTNGGSETIEVHMEVAPAPNPKQKIILLEEGHYVLSKLDGRKGKDTLSTEIVFGRILQIIAMHGTYEPCYGEQQEEGPHSVHYACIVITELADGSYQVEVLAWYSGNMEGQTEEVFVLYINGFEVAPEHPTKPGCNIFADDPDYEGWYWIKGKIRL